MSTHAPFAAPQSAEAVGGRSAPDVGYYEPMRLHIVIEDGLVTEIDRRAASRRRSAFIGQAIRRALEDERRWDDIEAALATTADSGHDWDADPAAWVRSQRRGDPRRSG